MNPKYQIFISSTYEDLKEEREQVLKSILRLGHIPIGMEMFSAANETQWEMIKRRIEESDYYLVIVAHRYGSIDAESGLSYTEKEYDYATSIGVPTLGFTLHSSAPWPGDKRDTELPKQKKLTAFIQKIEGKMRASWSNKDELAAAVSFALNDAITTTPRIGWVRANQIVNPETVNEMTRLSRENGQLHKENARLQSELSHNRLIPQLSLGFALVGGCNKWYRLKEKKPSPAWLETTSFTGGLDAKAEPYKRDGLWIQITVHNSGTLATDLNVIAKCDSPIVTLPNIEAFNERHSNIVAPSHMRKSNGWERARNYRVGTHDGWEFEGNVYSLKSGQKFEFLIPIKDEALSPPLEDAEILVSIFPETGSHIQQSFRMKDFHAKS